MIKKQDDDVTLISRIKRERCDSSIKQLIERHSKLFFSISNKYRKTININDIHQDRHYVIYNAAISFDPSRKTKFSTWLGNMTKYHCLNKAKKESKYVDVDDSVVSYFFNNKSMEEFNKKEKENLIKFIFEILEGLKDKRIKLIFQLRYFESAPKLTWKQVAQQLNLTPQTIINLHSKGKKAIRKKIEKST
jgi:RNA polymerase sigma factor (sigma-70 family)